MATQLSGPRRRTTGTILDRAVTRGEIEAVADYEWIYDLITGPSMIRVLMPGTPELGERIVQQTVEAALDALGAVGDVR